MRRGQPERGRTVTMRLRRDGTKVDSKQIGGTEHWITACWQLGCASLLTHHADLTLISELRIMFCYGTWWRATNSDDAVAERVGAGSAGGLATLGTDQPQRVPARAGRPAWVGVLPARLRPVP